MLAFSKRHEQFFGFGFSVLARLVCRIFLTTPLAIPADLQALEKAVDASIPEVSVCDTLSDQRAILEFVCRFLQQRKHRPLPSLQTMREAGVFCN